MTPYRPPQGPVRLIHEDAALLAFDKPPGLLSVPGRGAEKADCLAARVQQVWPDALTVHRLDMATSGLILMAKGAEVQRALSRLFEARQVEKRYIALVEGAVSSETGEVDLPLMTDWPNRPRQKVCHEAGKPSRTEWRVLERRAGATRLELTPVTGRSHQLRVHMAALGHPILGDQLYGNPAIAPRLCLHAAHLALPHPVAGKRIELASLCPF